MHCNILSNLSNNNYNIKDIINFIKYQSAEICGVLFHGLVHH